MFALSTARAAPQAATAAKVSSFFMFVFLYFILSSEFSCCTEHLSTSALNTPLPRHRYCTKSPPCSATRQPPFWKNFFNRQEAIENRKTSQSPDFIGSNPLLTLRDVHKKYFFAYPAMRESRPISTPRAEIFASEPLIIGMVHEAFFHSKTLYTVHKRFPDASISGRRTLPAGSYHP